MEDSGEEDLYKEWMSHGNYSVVEKSWWSVCNKISGVLSRT